MKDSWDPDLYGQFRGLRLRPALDLLARIGAVPPGPVVDLGCGNGQVGPALAARFPGRPLIGVDASARMLDEAARTDSYDRLDDADIATWSPSDAPALIYSNAALHWLPDHAVLLPRLAAMLVPGGMLAIQMPDQHDAPSHRLIRELSARLFPDLFPSDHGRTANVGAPADYLRLLAPLGDEVDAWQVIYQQRLTPAAEGHPVRAFTASTICRPVLDRLDPDRAARFLHAYDVALDDAYAAEPDGSVIFPFRRLFLTLRAAGGEG